MGDVKFQVGDVVDVRGVVIAGSPGAFGGAYHVRYGASRGDSIVPSGAMTLVERPRKKVRIGSVWEKSVRGVPGMRYVYIGLDRFAVPTNGCVYLRSELTFDTADLWREVPVDELEAEA